MLFNKNKYSDKDYNNSSLPKNRFNLFLDIYKNKTNLILDLGLILLLFSLPLIINEIIFNSIINNINNLDLTDEEKYIEMLSTTNIKNIFTIIGFIILSIGISGISQIIRRMIFNEDVLFWLDFKKGIKENTKTNIVCSIIIGILYFLINYLFISNIKFNSSYKITLGIVIAVIVIIIPVCLIVSSQTTLYNLKLKYKFKNGFIISFLKFYIFYPLGLLNVVLLLITLINNSIIYLISIFILPLFIGPMMILINMLIIDIYLDKYINIESFKEIYRKGLKQHE